MSSNNTRNPHHNRWGGKNNTWGNRNRKKKTANSQYNGSMSKIGGAIIGGIFLFTLAHYGLDGIMNAMDKVSGTSDKIEKTQDFLSDNTYTEDGQAGTNKLGYFIDTDVEIDAETVKDILDYMEEIKEKTSVDAMDTVIMSYDTLQDDEIYNEKVMQSLPQYSNAVTFVFISNNSYGAENMNNEVERVSNIVNNNITITNAHFKNVKFSACLNSPEKGYITVTVTFR